MKNIRVLLSAVSVLFLVFGLINGISERIADSVERAVSKTHPKDASQINATNHKIDTVPENKYGNFTQKKKTSAYELNNPSNITQEVEYDPETNRYILTEKIGEEYISAPTYMTFSEYLDYKAKQQEKEYFDKLAGNSSGTSTSSSAGFEDPLEVYTQDVNLADRLFGGTDVDIRPEGNIDLSLGFNYQKLSNPNLTRRNQRPLVPDFNVDINMSVTGKIGEKLTLNTNFNTQSQFDFDRLIKIKFDSEQFNEDDIIKSIEAGNVSLPLRSNLIQGSQGLFGVKVETQWGNLKLTGIASQQQSEKKQLRIENGAQTQYYEVRADDYDENRHFFLSHYFRENYERSLRNLPQINSLVKITRIEVWVTNIRDETQGLRDIVALADLGEHERFTQANGEQFNLPSIPGSLKDIYQAPLPENGVTSLFETLVNDPMASTISTTISALRGKYGMVPGKDFELKRAKKLTSGEFSYHPELGFISVNVPLRPDEVLAVAYEYDYNGQTYSVGQLDSDNQIDSVSTEVLFVKMLKSTQSTVGTPMWDIMMKNVYGVGAYQANKEDFFLDVYYDDAGNGYKRFLPEVGDAGKPLLQVFELDKLNVQGDPQPDGRFDYVPGVTILPRSGKVIFPVLEPFGSSLREEIGDELYEKYGYPELYDSTLTIAREFQEKNRFLIKGQYKSSVSSEISLQTFNLPEGSVTVRAGGRVLRENIDYEVDYQIGIVRILNESILASGSPIDVSYEDQSLFSFQKKRMVGLRAEYAFSKSLSIGGTYMHLWEIPLTSKVNIGDDPISNRIIGLDVLYEDKAPWLTKAVDAIPGIDTKAESSVSLYAEGAYLKPGHASGIDNNDEGEVYVDDFEGATGEITLTTPIDRWVLASIPQAKINGDYEFEESELNNDLRNGMNRALVNWYQFDPTVDREGTNSFTRVISQNEIFPKRTTQVGLNYLRPLDIAYYPSKRGPYNFDPPSGTDVSAGLNSDGTLLKPETRWGGIMRDLYTNDFQQTNIEYIEFWLLNPFVGTDPLRPGSNGELVFNLGNVSEDILKDGKSAYENGLPAPDERVPLDSSVYGITVIETPYVYAFSNDPEVRKVQDIGYDGLNDEKEAEYFSEYLRLLETQNTPGGQAISTQYISTVKQDPANDNFLHWDDEAYSNTEDILSKFLNFNGSDGNSPVTNPDDLFPKSFTIRPSTEDPNRDFTSDQVENFFEYRIPIERDPTNPQRLAVNEYVIDQIRGQGGENEMWYRFKVPIQQYTGKTGNIQDFRSIRFMRMYFTKFTEPTVFRFATLDLVRNQWRRWMRDYLLVQGGPGINPDNDVEFDISDVSIEENSNKEPFNYVLPTGIQRELSVQGTGNQQFQNEASVAMNVCNLDDGRAQAMYKNTHRDLRVYDNLKMFIHCESPLDADKIINDGDVIFFIRFGSDYTNNYYEYELPLTVSKGMMQSPENVWPETNNLLVNLKLLTDVKLERNASGFPLNDVYEIQDPTTENRFIRIKGNPNLGNINGFMMGIKNVDDGGGEICTEVWVNELRVSGLNERGGGAAVVRADAQLADFGTASISGNYSSIGWGNIEEQLDQRAKEEVLEYDASLQLEMSKFLPEESGVHLPIYMQISKSIKTPQFDPYDFDVELKDKLNAVDASQRDSVKNQAIDVTTIRSINLTNVRKDHTGSEPPLPWSISNFSATYGYTEADHHDPIVELDNTKNHRGILRYQYSYQPLYIEPFKNLLQGTQYLKFIQNIHLNPLPNGFSHNSTLDRTLNIRRYRFSNPEYSTWTDRQFSWDRQYGLQWNLTRNLSMDFRAVNFAVIDELNDEGVSIFGSVDVTRKEYIFDNLKKFGRTKDYNHSLTVNYNVPFKDFPFLEFINVSATSKIDYAWNAAAVNVDSLGHVIQNGQNHVVNASLSFDRLYNSIGYLKKINSSGGSRRGSRNKDDRKVSMAEKIFIRPLLMLKTARATYTLSYNSVLPGYLEETELFGLNRNFSAPGTDYIFGFQPTDAELFNVAENKGWFTSSRFLSRDFIRARSKNWSGQVNLEPFDALRIDLNIERNYSFSSTYLFKNNVPGLDPYTGYQDAEYDLDLRNSYGSYKITYLAINTLFEDKLSDIKALFNVYESNRAIISNRIYPQGISNVEYPEYKDGYGPKQSEVLIPAFLSAYTEQDPTKINLNLFKQTPLPNWRIDYNGLSKLEIFKDVFSNVSIRHGYRSTMQVNSFQSNGKYIEDDVYSQNNKNEDGNFYSEYYLPQLTISEQLAPLIGISIKTKNDIQFDFDYNKSRDLDLNFTNSFLHETRSEQISINFGYLLKDLAIKFLSFELGDLVQGRGRSGRNNNSRGGVRRGQDLNIACTVAYSNDITLTHQLDVERLVPERGSKTLRVNPTIGYDMNQHMNLQAYYTYSHTEPATGQSFPITNMSGGLRLRFKLQ